MGTKRSRALVRLCVIMGTLALLLPGAIMTASAAPAVPHYTECQPTRAVVPPSRPLFPAGGRQAPVLSSV
jgi:hypothetical protein